MAQQPVVSLPGGVFAPIDGPVSVTLSTGSATAEIRYTLDGSAPDESSTLFTGPISITSSATLRARATDTGLGPSTISTENYLLLSSDVEVFDSNIPISRAVITDLPEFFGRGGLRGRGNASSGYAKQPFSFETWGDEGRDADVSLLGMPAESDWVLNATWMDRTMMRDPLMLRLWEELGYYSPRNRYVEVYLNTDGGMVTQDDRRVFGDQGINSEAGAAGGRLGVIFQDPQESELTQNQIDWVQDYYTEFETALFGPDFTDPEIGYAKYLDADGAGDLWELQEISGLGGAVLTTFPLDPGFVTPQDVPTPPQPTSLVLDFDARLGITTTTAGADELVDTWTDGVGQIVATPGGGDLGFPGITFCPTGEVTLENYMQWKSMPGIAAPMGSRFIAREMLEAGDFETVRQRLREIRDLSAEANRK